MAIPPRRARLKKCQSEVKGLSFAEQKMIEKALKESLKNNYRRDSSESDDDDSLDTSSTDESSTPSPVRPTLHHYTRYRNDKLKCNIAKKSASQMPFKVSRQTKPMKVRKLGAVEDPVYQPSSSASINASLPPKPSIERNSKAITNIKLDFSFEEDDECNQSSSLSSDSEASVIVIGSSSDDTTSSYNDSCSPHYAVEKPTPSKSIRDNSFKGASQTTKQSNEVYSLPTYPGLLAAAVKKRPVKTQKILFKAVKKSSLVVPTSSKLLSVSKKLSSSPKTTHDHHTMVKIEPSVKKRPIEISQFIHDRYPSSDDDDQESWSSITDPDECSSALRNSKDSDKSFYQAQRKFAAYSSQSNQYNDEPSTLIDTEIAHSIPSTEDFLLFLCLRSSGEVPESLQIFNSPWTCSHQFQS